VSVTWGEEVEMTLFNGEGEGKSPAMLGVAPWRSGCSSAAAQGRSAVAAWSCSVHG
jgi:hypothetical protein